MEITKDFREFIKSLNERGVRYLVIGGYAVNFHGYPRYTKDIDFWLDPDPENAERLLLALADFGFGGLGLTVSDFTNPANIVQLGHEPYRIDLLNEVEGLDFDECFQIKEIHELDGEAVNFINLPNLIEAKKNAGRLKDLADAEELEKILSKKRK
ncbi:MAG: nucleotidyltransferase [Saprospiraceae bacterium]|jgi:predicted nucleotidyltransferase|nr:nucleotidyltransferase [Saprospiraceae bacterium]